MAPNVTRVEIARSAEEVFAYVTDPNSSPSGNGAS
jgi:hypothetical protein